MTIEELSARLERVERSNRRLRAGAVAALVLAAAGISMGQASPTPRDAAGKERASLGLRPDGQVLLWLADESGQASASMGVTKEGLARVTARNGENRPDAQLYTSPDGRCGLSVGDGSGKLRAFVGMDQFGGPGGLVLLDKDGKVTSRAP